MNAEEVRQAVMLVRPTVASLREVGGILLKETKAAEPKAFGDEAASYLETLDNLVLTWMAEGRHDELRELAAAIRQLLSESAANARLLSTLPTHAQLTVRLDVLAQQVAQLLLGDNLAKYMGVLSGKRYKDWRELLLGLYRHGDGAPVRRSQACEFGPPGMNIEAGVKAVDKLAALGLLAKHQAGPKNVQVELTWAGRRVAQAWVSAEQDVGAIEPEPPVYGPRQEIRMLHSEWMTGTLPGGMQPFVEADADKINLSVRVAR